MQIQKLSEYLYLIFSLTKQKSVKFFVAFVYTTDHFKEIMNSTVLPIEIGTKLKICLWIIKILINAIFQYFVAYSFENFSTPNFQIFFGYFSKRIQNLDTFPHNCNIFVNYWKIKQKKRIHPKNWFFVIFW